MNKFIKVKFKNVKRSDKDLTLHTTLIGDKSRFTLSLNEDREYDEDRNCDVAKPSYWLAYATYDAGMAEYPLEKADYNRIAKILLGS